MKDDQRGEVHSRRDGGAVTITISGEIDLAMAPQLEVAIREAEESEPEAIVVDMSELTFLDSSGLRVLLQASARAREDGSRVSFVPSAHDGVNRLIEMTGTEGMFEAS